MQTKRVKRAVLEISDSIKQYQINISTMYKLKRKQLNMFSVFSLFLLQRGYKMPGKWMMIEINYFFPGLLK